MKRLDPKQRDRKLISVFETSFDSYGLLTQMKELMVETLEQVKEKPMVWGLHYYHSYKKLLILEDVYRLVEDDYKVFYKKLYSKEAYDKMKWRDLEIVKEEVGYPLNDEEALFSNKKPNYMY